MPFAMNPFTNKLDYYKEGGGGGGTVTSVNGVANRTTVTDPTTDPIVDIAATYVGQTSITTLGTIGTGTWNGSTIGPAFGGTGLTTYTTGDLLFSSASNTLSKRSISTILGSRLVTSDTGIPVWSKAVGGPDIVFFEDDFLYFCTNATGYYPWYYQRDGAGASSQNGLSTPGHPGVLTLNVGTSGSGQATAVHGLSEESSLSGNFVLGGGYFEFYFVVNINTLSTLTDEYELYLGLGSYMETYSPNPGDYAACFRYQRTSSANWQGITKNAGTTTVASGGSNVAVATGWATLRMTIDAAASSVSFYVNGTLIGTSASNIPTDAAHPISLGMSMKQTAGTNERKVDIDYVSCFNQLTTSRF